MAGCGLMPLPALSPWQRAAMAHLPPPQLALQAGARIALSGVTAPPCGGGVAAAGVGALQARTSDVVDESAGASAREAATLLQLQTATLCGAPAPGRQAAQQVAVALAAAERLAALQAMQCARLRSQLRSKLLVQELLLRQPRPPRPPHADLQQQLLAHLLADARTRDAYAPASPPAGAAPTPAMRNDTAYAAPGCSPLPAPCPEPASPWTGGNTSTTAAAASSGTLASGPSMGSLPSWTAGGDASGSCASGTSIAASTALASSMSGLPPAAFGAWDAGSNQMSGTSGGSSSGGAGRVLAPALGSGCAHCLSMPSGMPCGRQGAVAMPPPGPAGAALPVVPPHAPLPGGAADVQKLADSLLLDCSDPNEAAEYAAWLGMMLE